MTGGVYGAPSLTLPRPASCREVGPLSLVSCYELGHQPFRLASLPAML